MIQDLSGSCCIKRTDESMIRVDSPVPLMHHDPDRSWTTNPDPDHPKGTHPKNPPLEIIDLFQLWERNKKFYYPTMLQSNKDMIRHTLIHASFSDREYRHVKRESLFEPGRTGQARTRMEFRKK